MSSDYRIEISSSGDGTKRKAKNTLTAEVARKLTDSARERDITYEEKVINQMDVVIARKVRNACDDGKMETAVVFSELFSSDVDARQLRRYLFIHNRDVFDRYLTKEYQDKRKFKIESMNYHESIFEHGWRLCW